MNERIKELRGQALRWSGENVNRNLYSNYEIEQKEYDKFAELIIEKCVEILVNHGYTDAATVLETEYAEDWQTYEFPKI